MRKVGFMEKSRKVNNSSWVTTKRHFAGFALIFFLVVSAAVGTCQAQTTNSVLLFDDFAGPGLNPAWQASLPNAKVGVVYNNAAYVGAPQYSFGTLDTNSVLQLTNTLNPLSRVGWSSATNFAVSSFHYEARFNTLVQSAATSIDGFVEIWIFDPSNTNRYDIVSLFGGSNSNDPRFYVGSSIDNFFTSPSYGYQNNTWYRLVLDAPVGQNIRASLYDDSGTEVIGLTLNHGASAYNFGFKIAISQAIGIPYNPSPANVALDYVSLTGGQTTNPPPVAPLITSQPTSRSVTVGSSTTFSVGASGSLPLSYQWAFNGGAIAAATKSSLSLTNIQASQAGNYSVVVSNIAGSVTSSNALLTVTTAPPSIVSQPTSRSVTVGSSTTFSVGASGSLPLSYQWAFNGGAIAAATKSSLSLTNIQASQAGNYSVVVSNIAGSVTSSNALLTVVSSPPYITSQPAGKSIPVGGTATFTVMAQGTQPLSYQWYFGGSNAISGATGSSLTLTNVQSSQAGSYSVVVSNIAGSVTSWSALLEVIVPPSVSTNVLFFDDFAGPDLNGMWEASLPDAHMGVIYSLAHYVGAPQFGFAGLGTNSVLRMTNTLSPLTRVGWSSSTNFFASDFHYEVRFNTLNQSSDTSIDGFMEIWVLDAANSNRYDIVSLFGGSRSADRRFFVGSSIDGVYSSPSFNYQSNTWYRLVLEGDVAQNLRASLRSDDGTELIGATLGHNTAAFSSGFKIAISQAMGIPYDPSPVDAAVDYVILNGSSSTVFPPEIVSQPANQSVLPGGTAVFTVVAGGTGPFDYQWYFNGTNLIAGATNASLTLSNVQASDVGAYDVVVGNGGGSITSSNAWLKINGTPVAIAQQVSVSQNTAVAVTLSGTDPDNNPLSYIIVSGPTNGTLSGNAPDLTYLPAANFTGSDSFSFKVNDGSLDSDVAVVSIDVAAAHLLFADDFTGPDLDGMWTASLPDAHMGVIYSLAHYVGAPQHGFESVDPNSVLRMTNTLSPLTRVGWSSSTNFFASDFHYEVRFNTLNQSSETSIDAFMEIWILDAANSNRYDIVSLFGGSRSADRRFFVGSSIDGVYSSPSFNYQNNTWYRLVLEGEPGQNIRASLRNDAGVELAGLTLNHGADAFSSGFKIAISQAMGIPYDPSPVDVAVDYVRLTTSSLPATPASMLSSRSNSKQLLVANPTLQLISDGNSLTLSWPATAASFELQASDDFASTNWLSLSAPLTTNGNVINATVQISAAHKFYRLHHP
jgi:Bacterial Ig domain/Immunoglobulin domain